MRVCYSYHLWKLYKRPIGKYLRLDFHSTKHLSVYSSVHATPTFLPSKRMNTNIPWVCNYIICILKCLAWRYIIRTHHKHLGRLGSFRKKKSFFFRFKVGSEMSGESERLKTNAKYRLDYADKKRMHLTLFYNGHCIFLSLFLRYVFRLPTWLKSNNSRELMLGKCCSWKKYGSKERNIERIAC